MSGRRTRREPLAWHERFDPRARALHDVNQRILAQNARVTGQYATVALLLPFTSTDPSIDPSVTDMVHAVESA